ncbi:MAG: peptidoglycan-binding protein [Clostridia bacterium]|nr:peptidoglycan-binding protein [Clostridia bacterium]
MRKARNSKKYLNGAHIQRTVLSGAAAAGLLLCLGGGLLPHSKASCSPVQPAVKAPAAAPTEAHPYTEEDLASISVFLAPGDRGTHVRELQSALVRLGYDTECSGVYTLSTARAVKRFQEDSGFVCDGICSAALSHAVFYLCGSDADTIRASYNDGERRGTLCAALNRAGCLPQSLSPTNERTLSEEALRGALTVFQRTHGLCGTGEVNYATLCALGLETGSAFPLPRDTESAFNESLSDLHVRQIAWALAHLVLLYPEANDLRTLTACAAILIRRTQDMRWPNTLSAVCAAGILPQEASADAPSHPMQDAIAARARDPLFLYAAEYALSHTGGSDPACGALAFSHADSPLPEGADVCMRTSHFVFYR